MVGCGVSVKTKGLTGDDEDATNDGSTEPLGDGWADVFGGGAACFGSVGRGGDRAELWGMKEWREATLRPARDLVGLLYRVLAIDSYPEKKIQEFKKKQGAIFERKQGNMRKIGEKMQP